MTMQLVDGCADVPKGKVASIVTSLEMLSRPPIKGNEMGSRYKIQQKKVPPLEWYRDIFRTVGAPWMWTSRLEMSDAMLRHTIHNPLVEIYALYVSGEEKGLLELDFSRERDCELGFFGVTPDLIGQGAGGWLMQKAMEIAWAKPIVRFWLHTCTHDHPHALSFYLQAGFTPFKCEVDISDDPRISGLLPRDVAPHVPIL